MTIENSSIEFPDKIEARIQDIARETDSTREEVINRLLNTFFAMVDDPMMSDILNAPPLVEKVRKILRENQK